MISYILQVLVSLFVLSLAGVIAIYYYGLDALGVLFVLALSAPALLFLTGMVAQDIHFRRLLRERGRASERRGAQDAS